MSTTGSVQDAFDLWRKSLEEGTQAWLRAMGQAATPPPSQPPPFDFGQFWRPILTQGLEMWQKAAAQGRMDPQFAQQWKGFLDQWVEAWSKALSQVMATEGFAQGLGRYLDQMLAAQAPLKKELEQYTDTALKTLGLPSRGQVVGLASQVVALEERIEGLEDRLDEVKGLVKEAILAITDHEAAARRRATAPAKAARVAKPKEGG